MASWAIIENKGLILLVQRSTGTSRAGQWCFPGGGIKDNELASEACVREVKEEIRLDVEVVCLVSESEKEFYFKCRLIDDQQTVELKQNEVETYEWIEPENILDLGIIMNLKAVYPILLSMGYRIKLTSKVKNISARNTNSIRRDTL